MDALNVLGFLTSAAAAASTGVGEHVFSRGVTLFLSLHPTTGVVVTVFDFLERLPFRHLNLVCLDQCRSFCC